MEKQYLQQYPWVTYEMVKWVLDNKADTSESFPEEAERHYENLVFEFRIKFEAELVDVDYVDICCFCAECV